MDNRPQPGDVTDRNLALELVRVTEAAALAASRWIGHGENHEPTARCRSHAPRPPDQACHLDAPSSSVKARRTKRRCSISANGRERRGAPINIAVDPLEGTTLTSKGGPSALAVVALAEHGNFLHAPDIYMDKIAIGGGLPDGVVDLDAAVGKNLRELAKAKQCEVS